MIIIIVSKGVQLQHMYAEVDHYMCMSIQASAEVTFHKGALSVFPLGRPSGHSETSCQTRFYVAIHDIHIIEHRGQGTIGNMLTTG